MRIKNPILLLAVAAFLSVAVFLARRSGSIAPASAPAASASAQSAPVHPETESAPPQVIPITGQDSAGSLQTLADSVRVRALRGDTLGLIRLLIDDTLFRRHVWPASPAYDKREDAYRFVRGMDKANSAKGLRRMLHDVQTLGAGDVPESVSADTLPVAKGVVYTLKPTDGVRLFGGALEVNGAYRVLNYSESGSSRSGESDG